MKTRRFISLIVLVSLATMSSLHADVVPGRWEKLEHQQPGQAILVTLKTGELIECIFKSAGPNDLSVVARTGSEFKIVKSAVRQIEKCADGARDGTLSGLSVGFCEGAIVGALIRARALRTESRVRVVLGVAVMGAGIGALVGYIADKSRQGNEVLYQAPR